MKQPTKGMGAPVEGTPFSLTHSQRNPAALFGAGLIDAIPEDAIVAAASGQTRGVRGRVARAANGEVGRFGWKAQTSSLREFTLNACAVELGLEVVDHPQTANPLNPAAKSKGPDMTLAECDALVAFIARLPQPVESPSQPD